MNTDKQPKVDSSLPTYSAYKQYASHLKLKSPLSEKEWDEFLKLYSKQEHAESDLVHGLGFVPMAPLKPFGISPNMPASNPFTQGEPFSNPFDGAGGDGPGDMEGPNDVFGNGMNAWETFTDPTSSNAQKLKAAVNLVNALGKAFADKGGNIEVPKDQIPINTAGSGGTTLNLRPKAIEVSYSPNITNTVFSDYYREVKDNDANLYLSCIQFQMPPEDSGVTNYVNNILIPDLQTRANMAVGFNVNAEQNFTVAKITSYITTVTNAMMLYFFYCNIISYTALTSNTNTGMYALRDIISVEDVQLIEILGERLNNIPIPPRLREWAFWMTGIYKSNNNVPNSPICMFAPCEFTNNTNLTSDGYDYMIGITPSIQQYINALNPVASSTIGSFDGKMLNMLAKVCPGWVGQPMGSGNGVPMHDPHWMDVWSNSPMAVNAATGVSTTRLIPQPIDDGGDVNASPIRYVSHCDSISGVNQAIFSSYSNATGVWSGLIQPNSSGYLYNDGVSTGSGYTNRFVFAKHTGYQNGKLWPYAGMFGGTIFVPGDENYPLSQSGWYGHTSIAGEGTFYPPVDTQAVLGMSLSSNRIPTYQTVRWLMSFDEALSGSSTSGSNRRSRKSRDMDKEDKSMDSTKY